MNLKYAGPARDYSGYGEATRHDIGALATVGVQLTTEVPAYVTEISDYGQLGALVNSFENQEMQYGIKILHVTPNIYRNFIEPGKYHIGRVFWETDKLPLDFSSNCQLLNEIWTGSEYNAKAIRNAGVTKPIHIIPEAIDATTGPPKPFVIPNKLDYKFYSIFEWTERKNPGALLEAYWREFEDTENVSLTIKTFVDSFLDTKRYEIDKYIARVKKRLQLKRYAPLYLYRKLMDRNQIYRFHATHDCFVSAHRGEGWGVPQMEALLMKKPVISTNCGGIHEYLTHKLNALLVNGVATRVDNTRNLQWYSADQNWISVNVDDFRRQMRWVFDNREKAEKIGERGHKIVKDTFGFEPVGKKMLERLREIEKDLTTNKQP